MKEAKVKVLMPFVSGSKSFDSGDNISLDEEVAYSLAKKLVVEFSNQKQFDTLHSAKTTKENELKAKKIEADAKSNAILKQSAIQNELNELYLAVVLKEAELNGEVLSEEETVSAVESIMKRDSIKSKKGK